MNSKLFYWTASVLPRVVSYSLLVLIASLWLEDISILLGGVKLETALMILIGLQGVFGESMISFAQFGWGVIYLRRLLATHEKRQQRKTQMQVEFDVLQKHLDSIVASIAQFNPTSKYLTRAYRFSEELSQMKSEGIIRYERYYKTSTE